MPQNQKILAIIFGGTGDLAYRKLYPALYKLYQNNYLNENFAVIGTARRPWTDDYYRDVVMDSIADIQTSKESAEEFARHFYYLSHDIYDRENYQDLLTLATKLDEQYNIEGNRLFYLSVSPKLFGTIATYLKEEHLLASQGSNRLLIEKPFGTNLEESDQLNEDVLAAFAEEEIYRIDHYLGKEMIQAIPILRFSNPLLKKIWNHQYISNIQVTLAEDIGVEDRGAYYEQSGALRDMVQNHVLQIISLLLMEEPASFDSQCVRQEKIKALQELIPITDENITHHIVRGQYTHSKYHPEMAAYRSEHEVSADSDVETFVAGQLLSTNENWKDTPIYFRTGKRMKAKNTRIDIVFKKEAPLLFEEAGLTNNVLSIHIGPEESISFLMNNKKTGMLLDAEPIRLKYDATSKADDYERLLLNALEENKTNFVHASEVTESWKHIDSIRAAWKKQFNPLKFYPVMTNGPQEADDLLAQNGHHWIWNE